jgi:hypothetical protein
MREIVILTDYRECFGSKYDSFPYRSGLDKEKLRNYFMESGFSVHFLSYSNVTLSRDFVQNKIFIHDSIEDSGYYYKSYMEDIIYSLELLDAIIKPGFKFIRAHNNKVFMEMLKAGIENNNLNHLDFEHFGCFEEFAENNPRSYPVVIKGAEDAQGRKVRLGKSFNQTIRFIKELSRSKSLLKEFWEYGRVLKHKHYIKESKYRSKFILQKFIPGLRNDWKILIFGERYYILKRGVPHGDFRASGSKFNYGFGSESNPPEGIFDFTKNIFENFDIPYISLDVALSEGIFYLLEFQVVCFGSSTHLKSDCYYMKKSDKWEPISNSLELEYLYANSISGYIKRKGFID